MAGPVSAAIGMEEAAFRQVARYKLQEGQVSMRYRCDLVLCQKPPALFPECGDRHQAGPSGSTYIGRAMSLSDGPLLY